LVEAIREHFGSNEMAAETDAEAVGFYKRCGFRMQSLGEKYVGTERFWCVRACGSEGADQRAVPFLFSII
jgi:hypothetical protein